jgi:hypothetical protein
MGKTYRKGINKCHRSPKGRKKAILNGARKGAIPPDAWDDQMLNEECHLPMKIAKKLHAKIFQQTKFEKH